ncbi:crotonobetainyl-CoA:carnitine CoA-transferase CaiB-like acyl-CoA transferase [Herbaspirillum sp. Sphag1AN]|uniref:CoA transferase n=1 Tax=unclassified Herbaspirillum TaxID=2624150 RepID=UPI001611E9A3|nr:MULTISPECIES: CoA transferase [unclassified Herbaspirillum]MBB3214452.1 crotonobetainyl-CoA:carnitine CoA-transferase CaiB-like acyl-CoA transferase [Herbaspirillum sp. Sphag1AN]MBB3247444.1 crotonobetainyl-CoA:carnitine CoA-transferase CaiB-like acyl-CoA transferase [Herbaspirillum sp. Sphag64]
MADTPMDRRDFIKLSGTAVLGVAMAGTFSNAAAVTPSSVNFDINTAFTDFMKGIGGSASDGGGTIEFSGQDPIVRSHFRIASCMAIPAMGAAVGAAAIWKERTGQGQDIKVDLREAMYNVNPLMTIIMRKRMALGVVPADDPIASRFSFIPTVNGHWYQAPLALGNPVSFGIFPTKDDRQVTITGVYPHLLERALNLLNAAPNRKAVASAIRQWKADDLDAAMEQHRVIGAIHRTSDEWLRHPQGQYLSTVPLIEIVKVGESDPVPYTQNPTQPLSGVRTLALTHVIAGSCAARTLAEYGSEVLHVARDQAFEHEGLVTDVNVGMRSTYMDLRRAADSQALVALLPKADVFIESFSGRSIERLGFGVEEVAKQRPGIIYLSLRCYGWDGPWRERAGFDMEGVTVSGYTMAEGGHRGAQFSANYGDAQSESTVTPAFPPTLVINDYIAGYLGAAGVIAALRRRATEGGSYHVRISLTRAAMWYQSLGIFANTDFAPTPAQMMVPPETITRHTPYGEIHRLAPLAKLSATPGRWRDPLVAVRGGDKPEWES